MTEETTAVVLLALLTVWVSAALLAWVYVIYPLVEESAKVDRPYAGMLFYNDEGSENGGLVFGGHRNAQGEVVDSGGSLTFDPYGGTGQIVQLAGVDDSQNHIVGLTVWDTDAKRSRRIVVGTGG